MTDKPELNILLLGETGAGKSTTVNALANYLKFSTFNDALYSLNDLVEVIATQFKLADKNNKEYVIQSCAKDGNERTSFEEIGESATQYPNAYKFVCNNYTIRIIDTPGIGDTSSIGKDDKSFDKIFSYLQQYKHLNAILFIVTQNQSRKTAFFKYCIAEIIAHLHKSVTDNIMFCFTHSKTSNFMPDDGINTLKSLLEKDISEVKLKLEWKKNCFFIDSEAYRYLVAKRNANYPLRKSVTMSCEQSWNKSAKQIEKMFECIKKVKPHPLHKTLSLNVVRKTINQMIKPIVQMQQIINENIGKIRQCQEKLKDSNHAKVSLESLLYVEVWNLDIRKYESPNTVCIDEECTTLLEVDGDERLNHQICHKNCRCWWVTEDETGQLFHKTCQAAKYGLGKIICKECEHDWSMHKHLTYEFYKVKRTKLNENVQDKINSTEEIIAQINENLAFNEQLVSDYEKEFKIIQDVAAKFSYILQENSFFTHTRYFENYLDYLIKLESHKSKPNIMPLINWKNNYRESGRVLAEVIRKDINMKVKLEDVPVLKKTLLNLKHSGPNFRQILETIAIHDQIQEREIQFQEKVVINFSDKLTRLALYLNSFFEQPIEQQFGSNELRGSSKIQEFS